MNLQKACIFIITILSCYGAVVKLQIHNTYSRYRILFDITKGKHTIYWICYELECEGLKILDLNGSEYCINPMIDHQTHGTEYGEAVGGSSYFHACGFHPL